MMTPIATPANWAELKTNQWCEKIAPAIPEHRNNLKNSILAEGFRSDDCYRIVLFREADGTYSILDGRTRHEVCVELDAEGHLKKEPLFTVWTPEDETDSPWLFALRTNADRRHLAKYQLAALAIEDPRVELLKAEGLKAKSEGGSKSGATRRGENEDSVSDTLSSTETNAKKTAAKLAKAVGTNAAAVEQCQRLKKDAPDLLERVKAGEFGSARGIQILGLRKCAPDLAKAVECGELTFAAAEEQAIKMGLKPAQKPRAPKEPAQSEEPSSTDKADTPSPVSSVSAPALSTQSVGLPMKNEPPLDEESEVSFAEEEKPESPTEFFNKKPIACQTDIYSAHETAKMQPKRVTLSNELADAGQSLAMHYDRIQTSSLIRSWARFWQPSLMRNVIQILTQMENSK